MISKKITGIKISDYRKQEYYQTVNKFIKGKNVLDVGCVDEKLTRINKNRLWNHWFIYKQASSVVGIDIEYSEINKLKSMGFDVITMSAEEIYFKKKFDTVFAGELIEHLPNPGLFLQKAKNALKKKGVIVLSTPNTYAINKIIRVIQYRTNNPPENPDHTMYFTPENIKTLADKCGLKVIKIDYSHFPFTEDSLLIKLNKIACRVFGEKFKEQLIAVLK